MEPENRPSGHDGCKDSLLSIRLLLKFMVVTSPDHGDLHTMGAEHRIHSATHEEPQPELACRTDEALQGGDRHTSHMLHGHMQAILSAEPCFWGQLQKIE